MLIYNKGEISSQKCYISRYLYPYSIRITYHGAYDSYEVFFAAPIIKKIPNARRVTSPSPSIKKHQPTPHAAAESVLFHFLQVSQRFPISVHYFFFPSFDSTDLSKPVQVTLVRFIKAYLVLAKDLKDGE